MLVYLTSCLAGLAIGCGSGDERSTPDTMLQGDVTDTAAGDVAGDSREPVREVTDATAEDIAVEDTVTQEDSALTDADAADSVEDARDEIDDAGEVDDVGPDSGGDADSAELQDTTDDTTEVEDADTAGTGPDDTTEVADTADTTPDDIADTGIGAGDTAPPVTCVASAERCNGIDDDCDGQTDEQAIDATTFYVDGDGDGHGDFGTRVHACEAPPGYAATFDDCDDADATRYPGAPERCDGVDHDCDGAVDEPESVDAMLLHFDGDGDGFGDPERTSHACRPSAVWITDASDCDDRLRAVHPGADERCNARDDDCDGELDEDAVDTTTYYRDADGDGFGTMQSVSACSAPQGYVTRDGDCDDGDPTRYPNAPELCTGGDHDCDGESADSHAVDARFFWPDRDGDGYGALWELPLRSCTNPPGYQPTASDCDDFDVDVHPGASERCDGIDNNCDGLVDDDSATDRSVWYRDADLDNFGAGEPILACSAPPATATNDDDCDDGRADVYPGAPERCGGVDHDCDGLENEASSIDAPTWYLDLDGDGFGGATSVAACTQPPDTTSESDDCDDSRAAVNPGATEVCNGLDDDCDPATLEEAVRPPASRAPIPAGGYAKRSLRAANFACQQLSGVSFAGADLRHASFRRADLRDADLSGADLRWADLEGADLRGADLTDADLTGASTRHARFQ